MTISVPTSGDVLVNLTTANTQWDPTVAGLPDGGWLVLWTADGAQDGSGWGVFARRFDALGRPLGGEVQVSGYGTADQTAPAVVALTSGHGAAMVYQSNNGSIQSYLLKQSNGIAATGWGAAQTTTPPGLSPAIAALAHGESVVVTHSVRGSTGSDIYLQRYDSKGAPSGPELLVNGVAAGDQLAPAAAGLANGGWVVVWNGSGVQDANGVYARVYAFDGTVLVTDFAVNAATATVQDQAVVAATADGFVVAWASINAGYGSDIVFRRFTTEGMAAHGEVVTVSSTDQYRPALAALGNGDVVVAWQALDAQTQTQAVWYQRFDANGTARADAVRVTSASATPYDPAISVLADGGFVIAWEQYDNDGSGYNIHVRRFDAAGRPVARWSGDGADDVMAWVGSEAVASVAGAGNDSLSGGVGDDILDGGAGDDAAIYAASGLGYRLSSRGGQLVVIDVAKADGDTGSDTLVGIERIAFAEGTARIGSLAEQAVPSAASGLQHGASVVALAKGQWAVSWMENASSGSFGDVYVQRHDAAGQAVGSPIKANVGQAGYWEASASLAALPDGGFVVVWGGSGSTPLLARRFDAAGNPLGGEVTVTTTAMQDTLEPVVAGTATGFVVAWENRASSDGSLMAKRFDLASNATGSEIILQQGTGASYLQPELAAHPGGGWIAAWMAADGLHLRRYGADGALLGGDALMALSSVGRSKPALALGANGSGIVVWTGAEDGEDRGTDIWARRFAADGTWSGSDFKLDVVRHLDSQQWPSVATLADGSYFAAWQSDYGDGSGTAIVGRRIAANVSFPGGQFVSGEVLVNATATGSQLRPDVVALADGGWIVAWTVVDGGLVTQRFDARGNPLQAVMAGDDAGNVLAWSGGGSVRTEGGGGDDSLAAGNGDDHLLGGSGSDHLAGGEGQDWLEGNAGNDSLDGAGNADTLTGGYGNDRLLGGQSTDTAVFSGSFADYRFALPGGRLQIIDINPDDGDDGRDDLIGIEHVRFADRTYAVVGREAEWVNASVAGSQSGATVAALPGGGHVVAWTSRVDPAGADSHVLFQRYDAAGNPVGVEQFAQSGANSRQSDPAIEALPDGGFVVAWIDYANSQPALWARRFDATGGIVGGTMRLDARPYASISDLDIEALAGGGWLATWRGSDPATVASQRLVRPVDAMGNAAVTEKGLDDNGQSTVTAMPDGGWLVSRTSIQPSTGWLTVISERVSLSRFGSDGTLLSESVLPGWVSTDAFQVVPLDNGTHVAAWLTGSGLQAQMLDAGLVPAGSVMQVAEASGQTLDRPRLLALGDGGWAVAWDAHDSASGDVFVNVATYAADGTQINRVKQDGSHASLATLDSGGFAVVWEALRDGYSDIALRLFDDAGNPLGAGLDELVWQWINGQFSLASMTPGSAIDKVIASINKTLQDGLGSLELALGAGNLTATGNALPNVLLANDGANLMRGLGEKDVLVLAADGIWGDGYVARNDGSPGKPGTGEERSLSGRVRFADVLDGGTDFDTVQLTGRDDAFFLHDSYSLFNSGVSLVADTARRPSAARGVDVEKLLAGAGDDLVDLTSVNYPLGDLILDGGAGNDILWANAGNDTLLGGEGADTLYGGAGNDFLVGGAGADVFQFVRNGDGMDTIGDFTPGSDTLWLAGAGNVSNVGVATTDHVTLTWGDTEIHLAGVTASPAADWFLFG